MSEIDGMEDIEREDDSGGVVSNATYCGWRTLTCGSGKEGMSIIYHICMMSFFREY